MHEVEVKLPLGDDEDVEALLLAAGARSAGVTGQVDTYLSHPGHDFAALDEALRIRRTADRIEVTFKGPRAGGRLKSRLERQFLARDDPLPVLEALGYAPAATVTKSRAHWHLGDVSVAVDDVAGLGRFLEVEALADDPAEGARRVEAALQSLGLADRRRESASYLELQARL